LNPARRVGTGVAQRTALSTPRPTANPAAAVLGGTIPGDPFLDPHGVPASALGRPVPGYQRPSVTNVRELQGRGIRASGSEIPTNFRMQTIGTGTVVSRRGGTIRTGEWEQGDSLRRGWEKAEWALHEAVQRGEKGNITLQERVMRARQKLAGSPLFDVQGAVDDIGKPFYAYQRERDGSSIAPQPQQPLTPTGAPVQGPGPTEWVGRGSRIEERPRIAEREALIRAGRAEIGATEFTREAGTPGIESWMGRPRTLAAPRPAGLTREQRADALRARASQIGLPTGGTEQVTSGQETGIKHRLKQAKTTPQKEALLAKLEKAMRKKGIDPSTSKTVMKLAEGRWKRGAKKRIDRQEQQTITDALTEVPEGQTGPILQRLLMLYDSSALKKNRAARKAIVTAGLDVPRSEGSLTAVKKAALAKSELSAIANIGKAIKQQLDERKKIQEAPTTPEQQMPLDLTAVARQIWQVHEIAGVPREEFNRRLDAAMIEQGVGDRWREEKTSFQEPQQVGSPPLSAYEGQQPQEQPQAPAPQQPSPSGWDVPVTDLDRWPAWLPEFPEPEDMTEGQRGALELTEDKVKYVLFPDGTRFAITDIMGERRALAVRGGPPPPVAGEQPTSQGATKTTAAKPAAPTAQDEKKRRDAFIKQAIGVR